MALTRLDNLYSSKTGKYLYVSPDDFNATDELDNRGNSPLRPFKTIQRAFIEVARYSYLPGKDNDRFDQFSIMLMPGDHYIDNRPGLIDVDNAGRQRYFDSRNLINANRDEIVDRAFAQIMIDHPDFYVPGDDQTDEGSRWADAYRLIQNNRTEIVDGAFAQIAIDHPSFTNPNSDKCKRDIGFFIDAVSLDISLAGGNKYTRKFISNYFSGNAWVDNGLQGEEEESNTAFNKARDLMIEAITNQLTYKDLTVTVDPSTGSNVSSASCGNVQTAILNLAFIVTEVVTAGNLDELPAETTTDKEGDGEIKCKRDIGYIVDAVASDIGNGGNANTVAAAKAYFTKDGAPISDGLVGEEAESITAFNKARDMMQKAVTNQLYSKDLSLSSGPAIYAEGGAIVPNLPSGNENTCVDVQSSIATLVAIVTTVVDDGDLSQLANVEVSGDIPVFNYNSLLQEWQDTSVLDLSNPDNVLYKFNSSEGGAIVPRGCSLIGYDLRRTIVRPLYVPDPADGTQGRTAIFNLTGGCYLWQFTIKDGDLSSNSPLYDNTDGVGKVYFQKGNSGQLAIPEYSHHKICIMQYAENSDLDLYYQKVGKAFSLFQTDIDEGDLEVLPQENRIVGPLSDTRSIVNLRLKETVIIGAETRTIISATTKVPHGYFKGQYIAIIDNGLSDLLNGTFKVYAIDDEDPRVFEYEVQTTPQVLGLEITSDGYSLASTPALDVNCRAQAEIDSVESASPYVFNCSIRSTWGQCGMWADGAKATGFRSMVVAQYTGVSLQKDDRSFIRYDEFSNTWNQASLTDAFATTAYHTKGDAYWKDDWRNFHIRASNDAFIQCVSVFAVGFFDHFLMESGGDMSITNSNSNFGNTSLHAIGFKGFAFNQDKGGFITDIIPVKEVDESSFNEEDQKYYSIGIQPTKDINNDTKLYYGTENAYNPFERPTAAINGYRIGAKTDEKIYVKLPSAAGPQAEYFQTVTPNGFSRYTVALESLNPDGIAIDNNAQDAANRVEDNKAFIQAEAYGYILDKYPELTTKTSITISKCERDIGYFVDAVVSDLRLGGNINTIKAAEGYYVGGQLAYIPDELNESLETYDYVKNLCIAAMRNFDYLMKNCATTTGSSIIDIGDTSGIIVGMKVGEYAYNSTNFTNGRLNPGIEEITTNRSIPTEVYVKQVLDGSKILIGLDGSWLPDYSGADAEALRTTTTYLYFQLPETASTTDDVNNLRGAFTQIPATKDPTVLQDTTVWGDEGGYPECSGIKDTIIGYFRNVSLILSQGLTPIDGTHVDAHNLILANKDFIANEAVERMLVDYPNFEIPGGNQECIDDVLKIIDALVFNIKYGSNNKIYEAAEIYVAQPELLAGERDQSVNVYNEVAALSIQAMRNQAITVVGSHGLTQVVDNNVIGDISGLPGVYNIGDCANIETQINNLISIITGAIGTEADPGDLIGIIKTTPVITTVTRVEPVIDTANLAARATLFTVDTGGGSTNPHKFETGTPVRLVPRAKDGTSPDKRLIRLPRGFDTNTTYFVIAPGRKTTPEDYSDIAKYDDTFTSAASTKLMLATTKENAAAGIYIYSSETTAVDDDVEIEMQQYILDVDYDLHKYLCNFRNSVYDLIQTDVPHVFDVPISAQEVDVHKVFFRTFGENSTLPQIVDGLDSVEVDPNRYYFARYVGNKSFAVFNTAADAYSGTQRITFSTVGGQNFYVFSDKRLSPLKFDATLETDDTTTGQWYINVLNESSNTGTILYRLHELGDDIADPRSKNTYYTRLVDERDKEDRIYRLRYVIPEYAEGVRDPLNGFVIKARTDETRKLRPQRILLRPDAVGTPDVASFTVQIPTETGTSTITLGSGDADEALYDPYNRSLVKTVTSDKTASKVGFSIQSARTVDVGGTDYLELTVFDHTITDTALKNETFVTVKISRPQNGDGVFNTTTGENTIYWQGNSSGNALVQSYFQVGDDPVTAEYYIILKQASANIVYNNLVNTRFYQTSLDDFGNPELDGQGNEIQIYADLLAKPNSAGSDNNSLSKSEKDDYLYSNKNANVLTITPGDIIADDGAEGSGSRDYYVASVEDVGDIDDSFYIFDINEIQRRIPNQQEGIYYLTCVKGNVSPYPTGAGVGENFRNFKFSQPISSLYPLNYKNDPIWFKQIDSALTDPPGTLCAADNYIHGLVRTNDFKNSTTKEVVLDLIENPVLSRYEYTDLIKAQSGNATSGSEDRKIPIAGTSTFPTESRLYVELRRPSIARSGNHTFEYLGFGPGNYSTGFPLRQEVVLEDIQDFYAQAKREDGGIVFYTGLNSNGDLYIGNRKINAITGEETFLERAELTDSGDDEGDLGNLVTSFELPVVFEKEITVEGDATFNNPVTINVDPTEGDALTVRSVVNEDAEDATLSYQSFINSNIASAGNIVLAKNYIYSAVYAFNPRGNANQNGQTYTIRTHTNNNLANVPSNTTPNQTNASLGIPVVYAPNEGPQSGDILLKGKEVGRSGSTSWVYANFYTDKSSIVNTVEPAGFTTKFNLNTGVTPTGEGIAQFTEVRLSGFTGRLVNLNGIRIVTAIDDNASSPSFTVQTSREVPVAADNIEDFSGTGGTLETSIAKWKETGVLGAEAIRTYSEDYGDFRLGINTIARANHVDRETAFVSTRTDPRATLDVVGTAFISGTVLNGDQFISNPVGTDRTFSPVNTAFLVGGDSTNPDNEGVFRVSTKNGGRVGINVSHADLDKALVVDGEVDITGKVIFTDDLEVNGGDISSTSETFSFITNTTLRTVSEYDKATTIEIAKTASTSVSGNPQLFNLGTGTNINNQEFNLGNSADKTRLSLHGSGSSVDNITSIGISPNDDDSVINVIKLGGGFAKNSNDPTSGSLFKVFNRYTELAGDLRIGSNTGYQHSKIQASGVEVSLFTTDISRLNIGTSAADIEIGATSGDTVINNSLHVLANTLMEGDVTQRGGLNTGQFRVRRGAFSTETTVHNQGSIDNLNLDFFKKTDISTGLKIDTEGASTWGGVDYKVIASDDERYYLPLSQPSSAIEFEIGSYILIDRSVAVAAQDTTKSPVGEQYSELLEVIGLTNLSTIGDSPDESLRVEVRRARNQLTSTLETGEMITGASPIGTGQSGYVQSGYKFLRTDHPDNAKLIRYDLTDGASYINNPGGLSDVANGVETVLATGVFSGDVADGDLFRFVTTAETNELTEVVAIEQTSAQRFVVNDGGSPASEVFTVDSTNGNTYVQGNLDVYKNIRLHGSNVSEIDQLIVYNGDEVEKFVVDSADGETYIAGDLRVGSAGYESPNADRLVVDADLGNISLRGGDFLITDDSKAVEKLYLQNSSGNLTISGLYTSTAPEGDNKLRANLVVNGGTFTLNTIKLDGSEEVEQSIFQVDYLGPTTNVQKEGAVINFAGQNGFFTHTGGRKWRYIDASLESESLQSNVNYFVAPTATLALKLPTNPVTGDVIRIVDVGGQLTYNTSLIFLAPDDVAIQGDTTQSGIAGSVSGYGGGELVVQTPNAGLGLVFLGQFNYDGTGTGAADNLQGWWLIEI